MTPRTYISRESQPARLPQQAASSADVARAAGLALPAHASTAVALTLPPPRPGDDLVVINASASGTAAHTLTCPAGVTFFGGASSVATLDAPGEALHLIGLSAAHWFILRNVGGVGLSEPAGPVLPLADTILSYSPYAYWKLDEASGTVAADSSGNGHDGIYEGTYTLSVAQVPFDAVLSLGGAGWVDVFSAGLAADFAPDTGSLVAFVRPTSNSSQLDVLHLTSGSPSSKSLTTNFYGGGTLYLQTDRIIPSGTTASLFDTIPEIDSWYAVIATWDVGANEGRLYINGALAYTDVSGSTWGGTAIAEAYIGSLINGSGSGTNWIGQIAHIAMFNTVLDADAVAAIYAAYQAEP